MTTHRNWHKRWKVSIETYSATHESGLAVRFLLLSQSESQSDRVMLLGVRKTEDGQKWRIVVDTEYWDRVREDLLAKHHGQFDVPRMMNRLSWEAGEAWIWEWNRKLRHAARAANKAGETTDPSN